MRRISSFLFESEVDIEPQRLARNADGAFEGMTPYSAGFTIAANDLEHGDRSSEPAVFPYIGGKELNSDPSVSPSAAIIFFQNFPLGMVGEKWPHLLQIVEQRVKPDRALRSAEVARAPWWLFWRPRMRLWKRLQALPCAFVRSRVSSHHAIARISTPVIPDTSLVVFPTDQWSFFSIFQSRVHEVWARYFSSSMRDDMRYTPSDCFETYPILQNDNESLEEQGREYYQVRSELMMARQEGLTTTYNVFHDPAVAKGDIQHLRDLHHAMDVAVLAAYGWNDLARSATCEFLTEDNEQDYRYQGRLFWPAPFREEVLARLLKLNAERAANEQARGLAAARAGKRGSKLEEV